MVQWLSILTGHCDNLGNLFRSTNAWISLPKILIPVVPPRAQELLCFGSSAGGDSKTVRTGNQCPKWQHHWVHVDTFSLRLSCNLRWILEPLLLTNIINTRSQLSPLHPPLLDCREKKCKSFGFWPLYYYPVCLEGDSSGHVHVPLFSEPLTPSTNFVLFKFFFFLFHLLSIVARKN